MDTGLVYMALSGLMLIAGLLNWNNQVGFWGGLICSNVFSVGAVLWLKMDSIQSAITVVQ